MVKDNHIKMAYCDDKSHMTFGWPGYDSISLQALIWSIFLTIFLTGKNSNLSDKQHKNLSGALISPTQSSNSRHSSQNRLNDMIALKNKSKRTSSSSQQSFDKNLGIQDISYDNDSMQQELREFHQTYLKTKLYKIFCRDLIKKLIAIIIIIILTLLNLILLIFKGETNFKSAAF